MPFSTAGPVSRHRMALGRIPGLEMHENIIIPGDAGRQFLASKKYCQSEALEACQSVNGAHLVQTVDWFLEFAPAGNTNDHYKQQFWTLVRDETGINIDRLTANNLEKIYIAFQDMRRLFKTQNKRKYPDPKIEDTTDEQLFFIDLLDDTRFRFLNGLSRFQLRYGLRRDDNFGERMATRVIQWRLRLQEPEQLLVNFPEIGLDVLPVEQQDEDFKKMAENYALLFNKVSCKTDDRVAADEDAMLHVDGSNNSPKTAMLKKMELQLSNLKADIEDQKRSITGIDEKLVGLGSGMLDRFHDQEEETDKHMGDIRKLVDAVQKKQDTIAADVTETKKKVSFIMRSGSSSK